MMKPATVLMVLALSGCGGGVPFVIPILIPLGGQVERTGGDAAPEAAPAAAPVR